MRILADFAGSSRIELAWPRDSGRTRSRKLGRCSRYSCFVRTGTIAAGVVGVVETMHSNTALMVLKLAKAVPSLVFFFSLNYR